jgi:hypothetical protein
MYTSAGIWSDIFARPLSDLLSLSIEADCIPMIENIPVDNGYTKLSVQVYHPTKIKAPAVCSRPAQFSLRDLKKFTALMQHELPPGEQPALGTVNN